MVENFIDEQCSNVITTIRNGVRICGLKLYDEKDLYSSLVDFLYSYHTIFYTFPKTCGKTTAITEVAKELGDSIIFSKDEYDNQLAFKFHNNNRWNDLLRDEIRDEHYKYVFFDSCDVEKVQMMKNISYMISNNNVNEKTVFIVVE